MHRTDGDGNVSNLFDDGDPMIPTEGTEVEKDWLNMVQEEPCNVVETGAGITLVKGTNTQLLAALGIIAKAIEPGGRLTLTSGSPISGDTSGTTLYYTPYKNAMIPLWNGSFWIWRSFSELSNIAANSSTGKAGPAAVAANKNYDLFVWNDSGTLRLTRGPAWSSDTARGTGAGTSELELYDGRYLNKVAITNGPGARGGIYVGSMRSDGSSIINNARAFRHVWNMYNRCMATMAAEFITSTWNYSTAAYRQANNDASMQLDYLVGLDEDMVAAEVHAAAYNTTQNTTVGVAIGIDGTSEPASTGSHGYSKTIGRTYSSNAAAAATHAKYVGRPGLGRHYLVWLEQDVSASGGTTIWLGTTIAAPGGTRSDMLGNLLC